MKMSEIAAGQWYNLRGDIVEVTELEAGKTPRGTTVHYILREKRRERGALDVGESGSMGIVNFASWASPTAARA